MEEARPLRLTRHEFVGAFGDIGTLLPLTLSLIIYNGISPGTAFALLGLTYIFVGLYYKLPVPVQPLKATAMIAIATGATRPQIAAAALLMSAILLFLAATRLIGKMDSLFPRVFVRGLQLGLGLLMMKTGAKLAMHYYSGVGSTLTGVHAPHAGLLPSLNDFAIALTALVLPQIPLTLGNSIVATRDCALKYFGNDGERVTAGRLAAT
ncbi:MAG: putative sulfate/molybdate transporter [Armatimonadota bacterium]|nr:putative sulfate/molybdate transporter [bacterium]